jgi:hypothetical protein
MKEALTFSRRAKLHHPPVSRQKAPCVLGELSPTLLWANAPTKPGAKGPWAGGMRETGRLALVRGGGLRGPAQASISWAAAPLLSPLSRLLVLFMEVQCTAYQLSAPRPLHTATPAMALQGRSG